MNRRTLLLGATGAAAMTTGVLYEKHHPLELTTPVHPALEALFAASILSVDGKPYPLDTIRGKPVLLNIWAPWCAPCVEELPELSKLFVSLQAKSLVTTATTPSAPLIPFIGLGVDNAQNISDFTIKHTIQFPLVVAGMAGIAFVKAIGNGSGALPFTVLFNAVGQPVAQKTGRVKAPEILEWLTKLAS